MITSNHEVDFLLGQAPKHIEKADILPFFVYAYEFTWTLPMFIEKKDRMLTYLQEEIERESIDINDLSTERRWWLFVLIAMREIAKYHSAEFAMQTVQYVLSRIMHIPEQSLLHYANIIQSVMIREIPDVLIIRPLELQTVKSVFEYTDELVQFLLAKKNDFLKVIKKHLIQRDLQKEYLDGILIKDRNIMRKFSNMWNVYFEVFIQFFVSVYDYRLSPEKMGAEDLDKAINELILIFLIASVENKEKIDNLHSELHDIMRGIAERSRS
ncbi:hypothetical protein SMD22_01725 (plasmid) [Brevibacillus halotolerans]|nr:hypothetical protein SMD22_01725 [Brevibacillus halotolerans]